MKGGIIIFDEISNPLWDGEAKDLIESELDLKLERFPFEARICYAVKL